ncbi:MAG: hypothetical protein H6679_05730 [Epsilonproteobacteria bacterium]|nr:hypothetical protein [Campylobacterota bacterium]
MSNRVVRFLWGDLEPEELKKYCLLSLGFFFIIGSWWPLKTLKDSIFINTVGAKSLPYAKFASLTLFFPLVLLYSKLVDNLSKERIIYGFIGFYGVLGLVFVYLLNHPVIGIQNHFVSPTRFIGWGFYLFAESYITFILSLYWSFINDVTVPESAKKGYGLIVFGTQLGGFLFTLLGHYLSRDVALYTQRAPVIALISVLMFFMVAFVVMFLKTTTHGQLKGYEDVYRQEKKEEKASVGFFDGLLILIRNPYVAGIFSIIFFQELITTMMGFQLSLLVEATYLDPGQRNKFLFDFALAVQSIACSFGLLGTSFFQRKLGIRFCLIAYPAGLGLLIIPYLYYQSLESIFYVMLLTKAFNYAFNQPTKEVLYIPTSKSVKYKSKAWIDMFGLRFSKAAGSVVNSSIGPALLLTGGVALALVGIWVFLAGLLGNMFKKTVESNELIQ